MGNTQKKREAAAAHNAAMEVAKNIMPIGKCSCGGSLVVYLASKLENSCTYYCLQCDHKGSLKSISKDDSFFYPLKDIVGEVRQHYEDFDKFWESAD